MPGYAAALAALSDEQLTSLLRRRPDLLAGAAPVTFPELASRAGNPRSLGTALRTLDARTLQVAELLAVVGLPTPVGRVVEAGGPRAGSVPAWPSWPGSACRPSSSPPSPPTLGSSGRPASPTWSGWSAPPCPTPTWSPGWSAGPTGPPASCWTGPLPG